MPGSKKIACRMERLRTGVPLASAAAQVAREQIRVIRHRWQCAVLDRPRWLCVTGSWIAAISMDWLALETPR